MTTSVACGSIVLVGSNVGFVRYVGPMYDSATRSRTTEEFVGLELVEATGDNDGSVNGTRYFTTEGGQNYGLLVPLTKINRVLSGWDLLKKFRIQHSLLFRVAQRWDDSAKELSKCKQYIHELEHRLQNTQRLSQQTPSLSHTYSHSAPTTTSRSRSRQSTELKIIDQPKIRIQKARNSLPSIHNPSVHESIDDSVHESIQESIQSLRSFYDDPPVGYKPSREEPYTIERISQASTTTKNTPPVPMISTITPQSSFTSDISENSSLAGWNVLEEWRAKATAGGMLPPVERESLPVISEQEGCVSENSYYIDAPRHIRLNDDNSLNSMPSVSSNLVRDDSLDSITGEPFSVIWGR